MSTPALILYRHTAIRFALVSLLFLPFSIPVRGAISYCRVSSESANYTVIGELHGLCTHFYVHARRFTPPLIDVIKFIVIYLMHLKYFFTFFYCFKQTCSVEIEDANAQFSCTM